MLMQVELRLPAALKQVLVDEHEAFSKGKRLPPLPRKPCVADILHRYVEESRQARQVVDVEEQVPFSFLIQPTSHKNFHYPC